MKQTGVHAHGVARVINSKVAIDQQRRIYVLENTTGNAFPTPGTGKIVRLDNSGAKTEIVTGLSLPTAMTFGPDGKLYVREGDALLCYDVKAKP